MSGDLAGTIRDFDRRREEIMDMRFRALELSKKVVKNPGGFYPDLEHLDVRIAEASHSLICDMSDFIHTNMGEHK